MHEKHCKNTLSGNKMEKCYISAERLSLFSYVSKKLHLFYWMWEEAQIICSNHLFGENLLSQSSVALRFQTKKIRKFLLFNILLEKRQIIKAVG